LGIKLSSGGVATIREEPDIDESGQERPSKTERKKAGRIVKKRAAGHSGSLESDATGPHYALQNKGNEVILLAILCFMPCQIN